MESRKSAFLKYLFVVFIVFIPFGMGLYSNLASHNPLDVSQAFISGIGIIAGVYAILVVRRRGLYPNDHEPKG